MYAVIEKGGLQYKISAGDMIKVQKIAEDAGKEITLENVLLVSKDDQVSVGVPYVKDAIVKAEVQGMEKGAKALIFKKKPRKGHKKLRGHRQNYTVLKIKDIVFGG